MRGVQSFVAAFLSSARQSQLRKDHALLLMPMDLGDAFPLATASPHLASSSMDLLLSPESVLGKINAETPDWLRTIVWTDFRLAVTFFVVSPLVFLAWSAIACRPTTTTPSLATDAVLRIVTGYWQASALLLITVLLNIESSAVGAITGAVAQGMIYVSLNWWESLNSEAASERKESALSQTFAIWRTIASWVAGVGVAVQLPFLRCSLVAEGLAKDPYCAVWLEPPQTAAALLGIAPEQAELLANATLAIYVAYLIYYVAIPLQEVGKDGRMPRSSFTFVEPLIALGFLDKKDSP